MKLTWCQSLSQSQHNVRLGSLAGGGVEIVTLCRTHEVNIWDSATMFVDAPSKCRR